MGERVGFRSTAYFVIRESLRWRSLVLNQAHVASGRKQFHEMSANSTSGCKLVRLRRETIADMITVRIYRTYSTCVRNYASYLVDWLFGGKVLPSECDFVL